jgi:hypothetical protein
VTSLSLIILSQKVENPHSNKGIQKEEKVKKVINKKR